jgi:hypothetical protein
MHTAPAEDPADLITVGDGSIDPMPLGIDRRRSPQKSYFVRRGV